MDKDYIDRKISNCQELVDTATSEAQIRVYQGYLEFWQSKLEVVSKPKQPAKVKCEHCKNLFTPQGITAHKKACEKAMLEKELQIEQDKLADLEALKELEKEEEAEIIEEVIKEEILEEEPETTEKTNI